MPPAPGASVEPGVSRTSPDAFEAAPNGGDISSERIAALVKRAGETGTDALVVLRDGRLVGQWYFGGTAERIETMSMTKSVVGLVIGTLVDAGRIALDDRIAKYFPEWNQGRKATVTIRDVLSHTSGLQADDDTAEIYRSPDFLKLALCAEIIEEPGKHYRYNNKAVQLLSGIVATASGEPLDRYARKHLFEPLGIEDYEWSHDSAGNPHAFAGLKLHPVDVARIGQLMLDRGAWRGRRIVSADWVALSTTAGQPYDPESGLLWFIVPEWQKKVLDDRAFETLRSSGLDSSILKKLLPLKGRAMPQNDFVDAVERALGAAGMEKWLDGTVRRGVPGGSSLFGPTAGYWSNGWLGQQLVILTGPRIVAVRMRKARPGGSRPDDGSKEFFDFVHKVRQLTQ